jgi:hypothetical protein
VLKVKEEIIPTVIASVKDDSDSSGLLVNGLVRLLSSAILIVPAFL